jgi:hypothetical protein
MTFSKDYGDDDIGRYYIMPEAEEIPMDTVAALYDRLCRKRRLGMYADVKDYSRSVTCPVCGRTSWNPGDVREGYCGNCHDWTSPRPDDPGMSDPPGKIQGN